MINYAETLAKEFSIQKQQAENVIALIDEGNTIPFIARYRKEKHGSLDDQVLRDLADRLEYFRGMDKHRDDVYRLIEEQGAMTEEIGKALADAVTLAEIDDIYRPYRPKRRTRASVAKEKGLEPLALTIFAQETEEFPIDLAEAYVSEEKEVPTAEEALAGALDIIAEMISDDATVWKRLRYVAQNYAVLISRAAKEETSVYEPYYQFQEAVSKIAGHRVLAINRGEREEFLKVSIEFDPARAMMIIGNVVIKNDSPCADAVRQAAQDSYSRLIFPSIERDIRNELTEKASEQAIKVFSVNLNDLLMQAPVKGKVTLGLDPGYAHGCKVAVVDPFGGVLDTAVIYPVPPFNKVAEAKKILKRMIETNKVEVIAIGNGTASRETEIFAAEVIHEMNNGVSYMVVSEAGASVYSASKLASEEFPDYDVNLRSAISIARRMQDPLAELVKIDPQAIGVGQYQHDMPKKQLDEALGGVVEACVNSVGVDVNTASVPLLSRVAGINSTVSKNIVEFRQENGGFTSRAQLKKVPKLGPKAFEQCAGFLRVPESDNPLDNTAVHPESYPAAKELLKLCNYTMKDVQNGGLQELSSRVEQYGIAKAAEELAVGIPTLKDMITELMRPGRDPRDELPAPLLRTDVLSIEDLKAGMELSGTVRNVIDFGAFVDIGVHQDGLVHISQICSRFIKHPSEVLKIGDVVKVKILNVDVKKKKISLTMK